MPSASATPRRCPWCGDDPLYVDYHDREWGFPVADDRRLFEKLCLEGFQSGLAWITILRKREAFREAFDGFDFERVARMGARDVQRLLGDAGIVRHRGKIESAINNAKRARSWRRSTARSRPTSGATSRRRRRVRRSSRAMRCRTMATSPESIALAKDLKRRGWTFVGPTTVYAFMQAMGLVNDHLHDCDTRRAVSDARARFLQPR